MKPINRNDLKGTWRAKHKGTQIDYSIGIAESDIFSVINENGTIVFERIGITGVKNNENDSTIYIHIANPDPTLNFSLQIFQLVSTDEIIIVFENVKYTFVREYKPPPTNFF